MTARDVERAANQIENSYTPQQHVHNFDDAYRTIVQMQQNDGGPNSPAFRNDMIALNHKLHQDGVISNLEIVGVDPAHHSLITRDLPDHRVVEQNPEHVNDFRAMGSGGNRREYEDGQRAHAMGLDVERNPDGSYEVKPARQAARSQAHGGSLEENLLQQLLGGGQGQHMPFGMNRWQAQAWRGWNHE